MSLKKIIDDMEPNPSVDQILEHHRRLTEEREWAEVMKQEDRKHRTVEILAWENRRNFKPSDNMENTCPHCSELKPTGHLYDPQALLYGYRFAVVYGRSHTLHRELVMAQGAACSASKTPMGQIVQVTNDPKYKTT